MPRLSWWRLRGMFYRRWQRHRMVTGAVIGGATGIGAGFLLYLGLRNIPVRYLFAVTNGMIFLLTAGLAAQAAGFLVQPMSFPL